MIARARYRGADVKTTASKGFLVLGIWLVLTGVMPFLTITIPYRSTIMPLLALAAGILIILGR
jgi:hypothetical protein